MASGSSTDPRQQSSTWPRERSSARPASADDAAPAQGADPAGRVAEEAAEHNEEAGEHFTPRDVVRLMADLILLPIADRIESTTYTVYDGACGTGGMLTVAEAPTCGTRNRCRSFTRYFYKPKSLRTLDEIRADILALEKETEGLLARILGAGQAGP